MTNQDESYRSYALTEHMWKVLLKVGVPLAFYEALNSLYKILDSLMASHINAESVSTVAYLAQINMVISSVGQGLAVGSSLKVSEAYGAGDYELVKQRVSSLFALCSILDIFIVLMIPLSPAILRAARMPEDLAVMGSAYFRLELMGMAITVLNNAYIAIERARGNTKRIFYLNTVVILLKLSLTAFFVYGCGSGILMISVASMISQAVLLCYGMFQMCRTESAFGFSVKAVSLKKATLEPLIRISFPVIVERAAFSAGKVIMSAMCGRYGSLTIGALGISNNVSGIFANAQSGIQAGGSAIISQNLGGQKPERALDALKKIFFMNLIVGSAGTVICLLGMDTLSYLYANSAEGLNTEFQNIIRNIFFYDALGTIVPWGIAASIEAFLYGLGKTRKILFINVCRLFVFRIFLLWIFQNYTSSGSECVGIVMMASNSLTAVLACIMAVSDIREFCGRYQISFFGRRG